MKKNKRGHTKKRVLKLLDEYKQFYSIQIYCLKYLNPALVFSKMSGMSFISTCSNTMKKTAFQSIDQALTSKKYQSNITIFTRIKQALRANYILGSSYLNPMDHKCHSGFSLSLLQISYLFINEHSD